MVLYTSYMVVNRLHIVLSMFYIVVKYETAPRQAELCDIQHLLQKAGIANWHLLHVQSLTMLRASTIHRVVSLRLARSDAISANRVVLHAFVRTVKCTSGTMCCRQVVGKLSV